MDMAAGSLVCLSGDWGRKVGAGAGTERGLRALVLSAMGSERVGTWKRQVRLSSRPSVQRSQRDRPLALLGRPSPSPSPSQTSLSQTSLSQTSPSHVAVASHPSPHLISLPSHHHPITPITPITSFPQTHHVRLPSLPTPPHTPILISRSAPRPKTSLEKPYPPHAPGANRTRRPFCACVVSITVRGGDGGVGWVTVFDLALAVVVVVVVVLVLMYLFLSCLVVSQRL